MSEMQFGSTDQGNSLVVESQDDGQLCVSVPEDEAHHHLNLQQTIQLRDFLNRHIDSLALGSIGASTERSSDDPAQLPAEHVTGRPALSPEGKDKLLRWLLTGDTGVSSQTIARSALGLPLNDLDDDEFWADIPHDASDFGRCYSLVEAVPELRDHLAGLAEELPAWKPFVENWDDLCLLRELDAKHRGPNRVTMRMRELRQKT